jgi:hypothetical protein
MITTRAQAAKNAVRKFFLRWGHSAAASKTTATEPYFNP